jgi:hypothetical protein
MAYVGHCSSCGKPFDSLQGLMKHYEVEHPYVNPSGDLIDHAPGPRHAVPITSAIRTFDTGATRDTDTGKLKYEGFFSPHVLKRRAEYMNEHRKQSDGSLREPDNWQKGISRAVYMDSLLRHVVELWLIHRSPQVPPDKQVEDVLCAILFNGEGYLYEQLKSRRDHVASRSADPSSDPH